MGAGCPENSESEPQGSYKSEGVQGSAGYTLGIFRLIVSGLGVWGFGFFLGFGLGYISSLESVTALLKGSQPHNHGSAPNGFLGQLSTALVSAKI